MDGHQGGSHLRWFGGSIFSFAVAIGGQAAVVRGTLAGELLVVVGAVEADGAPKCFQAGISRAGEVPMSTRREEAFEPSRSLASGAEEHRAAKDGRRGPRQADVCCPWVRGPTRHRPTFGGGRPSTYADTLWAREKRS